MKIRLTMVGRHVAAQVRAEVDALRRAVDAGDMDAVDAATASLLELTVDCRSVDLSEEHWRTLMNNIRSKAPDFESRYLLPGELFVSVFPGAAADDHVLELPIDSAAGEDETDV
jgi:hypothetical protein